MGSTIVKRNMCTLISAFALMLTPALPLAAQAQPKIPDQPMKMVVGFAAGGLTDVLGRQVAAGLQEQLKRTIVVENRPGAAGNISAGQVARSPADGTVLYLGAVGLTTSLSANPSAVQVNPITGLTPVGLIAYTPNVLIAGPRVDAANVKELVAKSKTGKGYSFGSSGVGGGLHLTGEMFAALTGANLVHVPYTGSAPAMTDLLGGTLDLQFDNMSGALAFIRDKKVRAFAVTSSERVKELPDVPTLNEVGIKGMEVGAWFGLFLPPGASPDLVTYFAKELNDVIDHPALQEYFQRVGLIGQKTKSSAEFTEYLQRDADLWARVVKTTGYQAK